MPRVLINETYGEYLNRFGETGKGAKAKAYHVNLWVELFNPVGPDPTLPGAGEPQLDGYQLLVTKYNSNLLSAEQPQQPARRSGQHLTDAAIRCQAGLPGPRPISTGS